MSLLPTSPSGPITVILPSGITGGTNMLNPIVCPPLPDASFVNEHFPPDVTPFEPGCGPDDIPQGPFPSGPTGPQYPVPPPHVGITGPTGPNGSNGVLLTGPTGPPGIGFGGDTDWHLEFINSGGYVINDEGDVTIILDVYYPNTEHPFTNFTFDLRYLTVLPFTLLENVYINIRDLRPGYIFFVNVLSTTLANINISFYMDGGFGGLELGKIWKDGIEIINPGLALMSIPHNIPPLDGISGPIIYGEVVYMMT